MDEPRFSMCPLYLGCNEMLLEGSLRGGYRGRDRADEAGAALREDQ